MQNWLSHRFTITFVYYGLSIHSVELMGSKHLNFILTNAIEVPAFLISGVIMKHVKRRLSQSSAFFLSGIACFLCEFIPAGTVNYAPSITILCSVSIRSRNCVKSLQVDHSQYPCTKFLNTTFVIDMGTKFAHTWTNGNSCWNLCGMAWGASFDYTKLLA